MLKSWLRYVAVGTLLIALGSALLYIGLHTEWRHDELKSALDTLDRVETAAQKADFEWADKHVNALVVTTEAHADDPVWQEIRVAALQKSCMLPYAKAELLSSKYRDAYLTRREKDLPSKDDMLAAYKEFETACAALIGKDGLTKPEIAWWLEHNTAASIVWQIIIRSTLFGEKLQDLKPLYDEALTLYANAQVSAEKVHAPHGSIADPDEYVSQSTTFMTRGGEQLLDKKQQEQQQQENQEQQQKPQGQGLGDLLEKAEKEGGETPEQGLGSILSRPKKKDGEQDKLPSQFGTLGAGNNRSPGGGVK